MTPDVTGVLSARRGDNRHWRRTGSMGCSIVLLASLTAACSLSFPIKGFKAEDAVEATGSIDRSAGMLSPALDREDWRRAKAALAVALDPQGSSSGVPWQNGGIGSQGNLHGLGSGLPRP